MKVIHQITDDIIRQNVDDELKECENEGWLVIPDAATRSDFVEECTDEIIASYESSDYYSRPYTPNYTDTVLDLADFYGYLKGDD